MLRTTRHPALALLALAFSAGTACAQFSPTTVAFPATTANQTSPTETTTLTNGSSSAVSITSSSVTAGYNITANTCTGTLAANNTCNVTMTFSPTTAGNVPGTLTVVESTGSVTAALTGIGVAATAPAITFPAEPVGATESATLTFTFAAATTLSSVSVLTQGAAGLDFTAGTQLGSACKAGTYSASQTCTVVASFKPAATSRRQGAVLLYDNESTPAVVATAYLQGLGTGANAVFYPGTGTTTVLGSLAGPVSPYIDATGNIVFADSTGLHYLPAGASTAATVATNGSGTLLDGAGNLFYTFGTTVYEVPAIAAALPGPFSPIQIATLPTATDNSMMVDAAGNLFIPLYGSGNGGGVVEIAVGTHAVTTAIAQGAPTSDGGTLGRTIGSFMDAAGDIYLADFSNNKLYEVLAGSSTITVLASGSPLNNPYAIAVDAAGDLFVTNYYGANCTYKYALVSGAYSVTPYCSIVAQYGVVLDNNENLILSNGGSLTRYTRTATPALAFGTLAVGGTSASQTVNVQNEGNMPLTFTSVAASSANFSTAASVCAATTPLAVGANCNLTAAFTPQAAGAFNGTANLVGNNLAATTETQTVALTGTGNYTLGFTTPPPASLHAGQSAGTVVAALENSNGSVNTSAPATSITLTITGPSGYMTTTMQGTTSSGTVTFSLPTALTVAGTYTYALSDAGGDTPGSTIEVVSPTATTHFTVTPALTSLNTGVTDNLTIAAYDSYNNVATNYTGTVKLSSTDTAAILPANFTLTSGTATPSVTFYTAGTQTVTATDTVTSSITVTSSLITVAAVPVYMVTIGGDDGTAVAANCNNISMGATANSGCYLRDAFAAVTALDYTSTAVPAIIFNSTLYGTTITLTAAITVKGNVTLNGPGAGLSPITLSGGGTVGFLTQSAAAITQLTNLTFTKFTAVTGGVLNATAGGNGVTLTNDQFLVNTATGSLGGGAAYSGNGTLTITGCTFSGNSASSYGGALYLSGDAAVNIYTSTFGGTGAAGTTTGGNTAAYGGALYLSNSPSNIYDSLFVGNYTANGGEGGAVSTNSGTNKFYDTTFTLNVANGSTSTTGLGGALYQTTSSNYFYNVTVTNNTAHYRGGGVYKFSGSLYAYDSIIEGNSSQLSSSPDVYSTLTGITGSLYNLSASATTSPMLSALGNYGGPTLSIIPLPGSPALRYASSSSTSCTYTGSQTTDQRGYPRVLNGACGGSGGYIDAGATQSSYALAFVQQPSNGVAGGNLNPAPTVQVYESGVPLNATPPTFPTPPTVGTLVLTNSAGTPTTLTGLLANSGLETITAKFPSKQTAETLTASLQTGATTPVTIASVTSTPFNIISNYIWLVDNSGALNKVSESGSASGSANATSGTASLGGIAFDSTGNTWSVTSADNALAFTNLAQTTSTTYTGGGLSTPVSLAVDGAGYIWVANQGNNSISAFTNAGTAITPTTGYYGTTPSDFATPSSIVLDTTGGIWVTNKTTNSVTHVFGAATPVTTPLSQAVSTSTLGTKP